MTVVALAFTIAGMAVAQHPPSATAELRRRVPQYSSISLMSFRSSSLKRLACLSWMAAMPVQASEQWFLVARHGECARVESLKRKVPDLGEVSDPHAFAALMRKNGHKVALGQMPVPKGKAYEVTVPEKNLSLVFVTSELCGSHVVR